MNSPRFPSASRCRVIGIAFLFFTLAARAWAQATGTIAGRVTNPATGGVVEHAHLTIEGTTIETFTDADGYYRIAGVPAGVVTLRAFFTGFPSATSSVS